MPAANIDSNTYDYTHTAHTALLSLYHSEATAQPRWINQPIATPIGLSDSLKHFYVPDIGMQLSISDAPYILSEAEDKALWNALRDSTMLVSKGRLVE